MKQTLFENKTGINDLQELINNCRSFINIDNNIVISTVKDQLNFIKDKNGKQSEFNRIYQLENQWYSSLNTNPDFNVYSNPYYLCDIWVCWKVYSNKSIKALTDIKSMDRISPINYFNNLINVKTIVDLGCGIGYTTSYLSEIFLNSKIIGTNLKESFQYKICKQLSKEYKFEIRENINNISNIDILFASEYFEHIYDSLDSLVKIIKNNNPKIFIIANAFNGHAIGHFNKYIYKGITYSPKETSKLFWKILRNANYSKLKTNIWNNRPSIWIRDDLLNNKRKLKTFF